MTVYLRVLLEHCATKNPVLPRQRSSAEPAHVSCWLTLVRTEANSLLRT